MPEQIEFPEPTLVPVNDVELEVFEAGQEHVGNPIVLCHGWPEHAFSWRHQVPALAAPATTSSSRTSEATAIHHARPTSPTTTSRT